MNNKKRPQHTLFEAGKMYESGYGNSLKSIMGVKASTAFMCLQGPKKDLFKYVKPVNTERYLKPFEPKEKYFNKTLPEFF